MRKEKKIIEIGENFTFKKGIKDGYFTEYKTLYQCYNRPSDAKINIYNYYEKLLYNNCDAVLNYGIRSYNSMIIVLHAEITKDNKRYYVKITPSYNWIEEAYKLLFL